MNARRLVTVALFVPVLSWCGACRERDADAGVAAAAAAPSDGKPGSAGAAGVVKLDDAQLKQVQVEELSTHAPASAINATGTVEFNADQTAKLLPPVSGQVQNLAVNVGDQVHTNDVLFAISSREVAAAIADHIAAEKDVELAVKTNAMTRDLFDHQAASRMALEQSASELAKAKSKVMQTEENLQVLGLDPHAADNAVNIQPRIPVRSPISGTVIERSVTNGQFVGQDTSPLITIADLSSVWVTGDIFERDLRYVSVSQKADVTTAAYPSDRFHAQLSRIASVVDAQTRTAKVRFLVANPGERLKPGMFATISLFLPVDPSSLTIPAKAVFVESGQSFAYVQTGPQQFARRPIETVASGSDRVRIVSGVKAGERVVSDGVLLLRQLETDTPQS